LLDSTKARSKEFTMTRPRSIALLAACTVALIAGLSVKLAGANWPQWRGPDGQGVSSESALPTAWSPTSHVAWKTPVPGRGHSSPIVWGSRVFLTAAIEGDVVPGAKAADHVMEGQPFVHPDSVGADRRHTLAVIGLDAGTGKVVWQRTAYEGTMFDARHRRSSFASATPVTDGKAIYAFFGTEGVYAYDFDGTLLWKASVGRIRALGMGTASSPVVADGLLILQCDEDEGKDSFLTALDTRTGREVWRVKRPVQVSWSTPVLVRANGRTELVANGTEFIIAYDPRTGKELWRAKGVDSNAIHTPLVGHGLVIVSAGYPAKRVIAIRPGGSGDVTSTHVAWTYDKGTAYVVSPILYGDHVYLVSDAGIVTCLDARTGAVKYEGGRPPKPAKFMSSPVAFDGRILLTSDAGDTFVVKAGPAFEVVGTNAIGEGVMASLALADGRIYIRGESNLFAIR
jgi:outer membrane protein assembly factor BamB